MNTLIFYITLVFVTAQGQVSIDTKFANDPKYNTEKDCNIAGQLLADKAQTELGTDNAKVFWSCDSVDFRDLEKLIKPGSNL